MKFQIDLFAGARELIGKPQITVEWTLDTPPTLSALRNELARQFPAAQPLLANSLIAVNCQYVADDYTVSPEQELALIPPVSGG